MIKTIVFALLTTLFAQTSWAEQYSYESISRRYADVEFDKKTVKRARMEGECLAGLKNLDFKKKEEFDASAEWTSSRSLSLLKQFSPCTVLIMMEVTHSKLNNGDITK